MKRPSFQFYPADWQANGNLRRCTHEEKGIWIDVMCLLHDQERYGVIDWSLKEIAQAVGTTVSKLKGLVAKDVFKGADSEDTCEALVYVPRSGRKNGDPVVLIDAQEGPIWYSSRMVRDEYVRQHAGASTRFKQSDNTGNNSPSHAPSLRQGEAPSHSPSLRRSDGSTSSSSSSSVNPPTLPLLPGEPVEADTGPKPPEKPAATTRGTRLPKDWQLPRAWGLWAIEQRPAWTPDHVRAIADKFRDHWTAKAGRDATKVDWEATWRNWVRNEAGRTAPQQTRADARTETLAGLTGGIVTALPAAPERTIEHGPVAAVAARAG